MPILLPNRSHEAQYSNKSLIDEEMRRDHFLHCRHFTGKWIRVMPLLIFCVYLMFMVIVSSRRRRVDPRSSRDVFSQTNVESRTPRPEYTIQTLNETSPLLRAETWKQVRQDSYITTPATLSETLICAICLDPVKTRHRIRELVCFHVFHSACIEGWWLRGHAVCPLCKQSMLSTTAKVQS